MAKADYILCDRCDAKIVYDGEGAVANGLSALGLDKMPALCEACRSAIAIAGASEQPLTHELRVMAGSSAFNDSRIDELLMRAADIIDAVANYRAVVERWADGMILDGVREENAAEERMYVLLDEANADAGALRAASLADAPRDGGANG